MSTYYQRKDTTEMHSTNCIDIDDRITNRKSTRRLTNRSVTYTREAEYTLKYLKADTGLSHTRAFDEAIA